MVPRNPVQGNFCLNAVLALFAVLARKAHAQIRTLTWVKSRLALTLHLLTSNTGSTDLWRRIGLTWVEPRWVVFTLRNPQPRLPLTQVQPRFNPGSTQAESFCVNSAVEESASSFRHQQERCKIYKRGAITRWEQILHIEGETKSL